MENAFWPLRMPVLGQCIFCGANNWRFFARKNNFDLYACPNCRYTRVFPLPADTSQVYSQRYFVGAEGGFGYAEYDKDKEAMRGTFIDSLQRIGTYVCEGQRKLLDVGAATGYFVSLASTAGFRASGVEISDYAARVGRSKHLDIVTGVLETLPERRYDVVTMWDVLEHVPEPLTTIRAVNCRLEPGGLLLINTPDIGSLYARFMGKYWHHLIPPEHLHFYTREGLSRVLKQNGFEILSVGVPGKWFSLPYILNIAGNWTRWRLFKSLSRLVTGTFLARVSLPLNLRDNFILYARKVR